MSKLMKKLKDKTLPVTSTNVLGPKRHLLIDAIGVVVLGIILFAAVFPNVGYGIVLSPTMVISSTAICLIFIYIIMATSLNLTSGCLGEIILGQAGFMSLGAYGGALFTMYVIPNFPDILRIIIGMLIGGVLAAIFGLLIALPTLRLKGDYFAIVTLAFGEIVRIVLANCPGIMDLTKGEIGLSGIPSLSSMGMCFVVAFVVLSFAFLFMRSRSGRAILATREDTIAAEAVGVKTFYYKIMIFTISAFIAGVGGCLYAHTLGIIKPSTFSFNMSINILVICVLGGLGSFTGSTLSAILITLINKVFFVSFEKYSMIAYAIALIVVMLFRPQGLLGRYEFSLTRFVDFVKAKLTKKNVKKKVKSNG